MNERLLPHTDSVDISTVTVLSDGNQIDKAIQILSISVTYGVNRVPVAVMSLLDGDAAAQDFALSAGDDFIPGKEIEIKGGYHGNEVTVFKGVITRHAIKSRGSKSGLLTVVCKDKAVKMTVGRRSAYFHDTTDGDVLSEIISGYGLTAELEDMPITHAGLVQYQATDWDFLISRAEMNGMLVMVSDATVKVAAPDTAADPVITLVYGATIIEFEAELDAESQWSAVTAASWDPAGQAPAEAEGADPGLTGPGNLTSGDLSDVIGLDSYSVHTAAALGDDELTAWSDALMVRSHLGRLRGRIRCQGIAVEQGGSIVPQVGDMIELAGLGERFNGPVFTSGIRHEFTPGNWVTDLEVGIDPKWFHSRPDIRAPLAAGMLPPIEGLHIGIVTALVDPDGENRIRVRLPLIDAAAEGIWARVGTLDAGEERGTFFLPEIDDEVVVGFLSGDPRQPIVLGQLNSSAKPAPEEASDDNHIKAYVSRSKIKLKFDDEAIAMTIEMPSGRIITADDDAGIIQMKDADGNMITLDSGGITIDSAADITMTASGDINISASNVSVTADMEVIAEGASGTTLSSGGTTTVKGSLVEIN